MRIVIDTEFNIYDEVRYKKIDTFAIFEDGEQKEEIKESKIITVDIQVGQYGEIYVRYGLENEDTVCTDCILEVL